MDRAAESTERATPLHPAGDAEQPDPEQPDATPGGSSSSTSSLWSMLACSKRASSARRSDVDAAYQRMLEAGSEVHQEDEATFKELVWWSAAKSREGARVLVLAPRGPADDPDGYIDMQKLLAYAVYVAHEQVFQHGDRFIVLWAEMAQRRCTIWEIYSFYRSLPHRCKEKLEAVHLLHPGWGMHLFQLVLWPVCAEDFWEHIYFHDRIQFMRQHIDLNELDLPQEIFDYDEWLDRDDQLTYSDAAASDLGGEPVSR
mmetsp:Transcript_42182/g.98961  ORF Transcript_42182/g.98961 Transcript_42182/m.98961 type:complete len:257 (+) Transcript_42182:111-881(+)